MGRPFRLMAAASEIRRHFKGDAVGLCVISNAKSGRCPEDCAFCAQSSHYATEAAIYPLKKAAQIVVEAADARRAGAEMFGIVTSGKRIGVAREWAEIRKAVGGISDLGLKACASLGILDAGRARDLKEAGLYRYHHNLETSRSFFPKICTTHDYQEDVETIRTAKRAGLSVCSGGLIGLGEGVTHRIEMALTLRELDVDSVPINILHPVKGTPLGGSRPLPPLEILVTVAVFRFLLPDRDLKLCGGKERNLRQLLPLGLVAGCNSLMTGNYLTTTGRESSLDHEMIADLGLQPTREQDLCRCGAGGGGCASESCGTVPDLRSRKARKERIA
ncbi:MAG: biotin synthase BioB [Syntrophaceae bacterium]|nr:biotin synthase BioB [Syntrophaceae bacterium]